MIIDEQLKELEKRLNFTQEDIKQLDDLVEHIVNKYKKENDLDKEVLIIMGKLGLCRAIKDRIDEVLDMSAKKTKITPKEFKKMFEEDIHSSIEHYICRETGKFVEEVKQENQKEPDVDFKFNRKLIEKYYDTLWGRDKQIIELRFGIKSGIERTPEEVGAMLGLSKAYIVQTETKVIDKIKQQF